MFIRIGKDATLIDLVMKELPQLSMNKASYPLAKVIEYINELQQEDRFPNLFKLFKKLPETMILNCGGMAILKIPYNNKNELKNELNYLF